MKKETIDKAILQYLRHLASSEWIIEEAYKFEFANFLQCNVNFEKQSDSQILEILLRSQTIKYDRATGIQFIQKSGRETLKTFIQESDVELFRQFQTSNFESVDWGNRTMSCTVLSAWLSSLFPEKIFPVSFKGIHHTINYLFETDIRKFPRSGERYILACQDYFIQTQEELRKYPLVEAHLKVWNTFFAEHSDLNLKPKQHFDQVDWNWLVQDFHLFVFRQILNRYKPKDGKKKSGIIPDDFEPVAIEGQGKLAKHMRYERDSGFIKKVKELALKANPMLNCEVCGFSFYEKYGELGQGFIEAHHKRPLSSTQKTTTTKGDIALLCSNCHKMIHRGISQASNEVIMTIEELKALMNE